MKNNKGPFDFKAKIDELNSQIDEKDFILERTKECLFVLENQYELKEKEISKIKNEFEAEIRRLNEEKFIFSIVMPIHNAGEHLAKAIDSVINQSFIFDNVEIILVDDGSSDNCKEICGEYLRRYPDNITYVYQENQGAAVARNNGLKLAKGKFVNFLEGDDKLEPQTLNEIYYYFNKFGDEIDVISMAHRHFGGGHNKPSFFDKYRKSRVVDITKEYDFPLTHVNSSFLRRSEALKFEFNPEIILSEESHFINKLILEKGKFGVVSDVEYLHRIHSEEKSTLESKRIDKNYFNPRMGYYFKDLIDYSNEKYGEVIRYIQSVLMYDLKWFFLHGAEGNVLTGEELEKFLNQIREVLQVSGDDIILSQDISKFLKGYLLSIKYNCPRPVISDGMISFGKTPFDKLSDNKIVVRDISSKDGGSVINGYFEFYSDEIKLNCRYGDVNLDVEITSIDEEVSFGRVISYKFNFTVKSKEFDDLNKLSFELEFDSNKYPLSVSKKS